MKHNHVRLPHTISFRIEHIQAQAFSDLLARIPGAQSGALFREVFSRGLESVTSTLDQHVIDNNCIGNTEGEEQ